MPISEISMILSYLGLLVWPVASFTRVVHQQFRSSDPTTWPPEWRRLSSYWQQQNWTWRFWTDEDEAKLFREELPELEEFYHWIPKCLDAKIAQADLSAYAILYVYGGVYADMDTSLASILVVLLASRCHVCAVHTTREVRKGKFQFCEVSRNSGDLVAHCCRYILSFSQCFFFAIGVIMLVNTEDAIGSTGCLDGSCPASRRNT